MLQPDSKNTGNPAGSCRKGHPCCWLVDSEHTKAPPAVETTGMEWHWLEMAQWVVQFGTMELGSDLIFCYCFFLSGFHGAVRPHPHSDCWVPARAASGATRAIHRGIASYCCCSREAHGEHDAGDHTHRCEGRPFTVLRGCWSRQVYLQLPRKPQHLAGLI